MNYRTVRLSGALRHQFCGIASIVPAVRWGLVVGWTGFQCVSPVRADSVAVPVHSLPHACKVHGFPQVMDSGVLGCVKDGRTGLWLDDNFQIHTLPVGMWAQGEVLFQAGIEAGLWSPQTETWVVPRRRIPDTVAEGQLYATTDAVLWADEESIHHLDLETNQHRRTEAKPLQGTHPVSFGKQVAWIEWGNQMGVHLWNLSTDVHSWIPSGYPSSLIHHDERLVWVSGGALVVWLPEPGPTVLIESGVQEVFSTSKGLCWTQWVTDIDVVCDSGFHLQRAGHQSNPVWKGESLYFTESDTLWVYKAIVEQ